MTSRGDHIRLEKGSVVRHHYEVVAPVGSGNFSKVYRVIDLQLPPKEQKRKPLAMKVIKKEYSSDAKYEKQMLITLHKNDKNRTARVSKMYECFVYQECPVFIMPIHGPSIRNRRLGINRGVVTREKLLEFAFDILETMDFVHFQCHMVHTDLKPENILIADSNVAENSMGDEWVVCDFGSASLWRMDKLDSDLISTRPYRAPEVVLGNKWHYAADMWSIGCILYEVAVGHRLFEIRDDLTHLHMMDRRVGKLPEAFTKNSKYSSKYFNARGEFLSTPDVVRFGKCRLTPLREMFRDDHDFLHLLEGLLTYDPSKRMTATEALELPMFDEIRAARARRLERQAEEAEARRQRRKSAALATAGDSGGTNATGTDSLMSRINSLAGTLNARLADRTDDNLAGSFEDVKKTQQLVTAALPTTDVGTAPVAISATQEHHTKSGPETAAGGELADKPATTEADDRSATETATTSRASASGSPGKQVGKYRSSRSNTGSASRHSTVASSGGGGGVPLAHAKAGKTRSRAVSSPATVTKGTANPTAASSDLSSSMSTSASASVVTKDVPNHRPVVDNHRASTGSAASKTVVPKLALSRLTGNNGTDAVTNSDAAITAAATATPTSKGVRTPAGGGNSSSSSNTTTKRSGGQSDRKPGHRTASPAASSISKAKSGSSVHTPRKAGQASRQESGAGTGEAAVKQQQQQQQPLSTFMVVAPHIPDGSSRASTGPTHNVRGVTPVAVAETSPTSPAATPAPLERHQHAAGPLADGNGTAEETEAKQSIPVALRVGPSVAVITAPSPPAPPPRTPRTTSPPPKASTTPARATSETPHGHQSPLERGVTAVGITNRTEPPVGMGSPHRADEEKAKAAKEEEEEEGEHKRRDRGSSPAEAEKGVEAAASPSEKDWEEEEEEAQEEEGSSSQPSPTATSTDGSPRATDYRSPVRCRPPAATPTDDISAQLSLDAAHHFVLGVGASSGEWASMEAAAAVKPGERAHGLAFPQTRPAPNLALNSPRSDGHRTPREVSPAPVTGRTGSPVTTARRPQQQPEAATSTKTTEEDAHELASTMPILRAAPLSRANSRSGSLTSTVVPSPCRDALAHTVGPSSAPTATTVAAAVAAATFMPSARQAHESNPTPVGRQPVVQRSPRNSGVVPRTSTVGARSNLSPAATSSTAVGASGAANTPAVPTTPGAAYASTSPSTKPVFNVSVSLDRLKSVPPSNIADVRGPSAIPVSASRRTVVKPESAPLPFNNTSGSNSSSGIPEHPVVHALAPLSSAPQGTTGKLPHPPESGVTHLRERPLVMDAAEKEKGSTSHRGSTNSPTPVLSTAVDATIPKTPRPSSSAAANSAATGTVSVSLPSTTAPHPTPGIVRQRSSSTHLVPGHHPSISSSSGSGVAGGGLEGSLALSASQLGMYTPRGTRLLQEYQASVSGRSSPTLPAVLPGGGSSGGSHANASCAGAPPSPPPPSHGNRASLSLATPGITAEGESTGSHFHERNTPVTTVDSRPVTPRGSDRASVKSLDLQQMYLPTSDTGNYSNPRPPRSSISSSSTGTALSPVAAGSKSPRSRSKLGNSTAAAGHGGQTALNASTSSLHLGVTRSPRRPVAPGAHNSNNGATMLMASVDAASTASARSLRSASRVTNSPRGTTSRTDSLKIVSPRRAPPSPSVKPTGAATSSVAEVPATADAAVAPASPSAPPQSAQQQPTSQKPTSAAASQGASRLTPPHRTITVISSKPSSSAQLSRYSNASVVAPTRTSALRPTVTTSAASYVTDLMGSFKKPHVANGLNVSYKSTSASATASIASNSRPVSRQNSAMEQPNINSVETGSASRASAPTYRRDARTLKRIVVQRPSPQSPGTSMVLPQELGDDEASSTSPATSTN